MIRRLTLIALVILAGCNKAESPAASGGGGEAKASPDAKVAAAAASPQLSPGEWEMTTEMLDMNIPGMPKGALPPQLTKQNSFKSCMKQQKPDASFFQGKGNSNCTYSDFSMDGGRIKGAATCDTPSGKMTMTMDGEYHPDRYDLTMAMKGGEMSMKMHTVGRRIGECSAADAAADSGG